MICNQRKSGLHSDFSNCMVLHILFHYMIPKMTLCRLLRLMPQQVISAQTVIVLPNTEEVELSKRIYHARVKANAAW